MSTSLGLMAVTGLSACSLIFQRPTVHVAEVQLTSLNLRGGTLAVTLRIRNPNRFALQSQDFRYGIAFLERSSGADTTWARLAEGEAPEPVTVPAHGTGTVTLDVPFDLASVGAAAGRLLRQGELEYRFTGEIRFKTPLGGKRLPLDQRGTLKPAI
jgi:LEA14-like dessication related protein